ncbi:resolvase [Salmonella enterica]|nr:resolvase [Salmonella enterica]HBC0233093.1 recombinase family protein [Salmonella enterica subsp. enterica serovar Napoli]EBH1716605.1 resolvase [Salmonella enterica]EBI1908731.1 resolvase [Salmonella enterica]EBJ1347143.1 resolvase [Salmonella enterica]
MTRLTRIYCRASTKEQDASRALADLVKFAADNKLTIAKKYIENESGSKLDRPKLFELLEDSEPGEILLVEQVDRLSRLNAEDWAKLRALIASKGVSIVALDLPTSHGIASSSDPFTGRMLEAVNGMLLDMLAAIARKDYEDRRRRQSQGIEKAKSEGKYKGRPADEEKRAKIRSLMAQGIGYNEIKRVMGCGNTIMKSVKEEMAQEAAK